PRPVRQAAVLVLVVLLLPAGPLLLLRAELGPGVAAVARDVQAAAGPAAGQVPRLAAGRPQAGEQDARVVRVHRHVGGAGVRVLEQDAVPGGAAVAGPVDAAL